MLFTDPCFLFLFLPIVLTAYYITPRSGKNVVLLAASILFYALGEGWSTFVVLASIAINFFIGKWIEREGTREKAHGALLIGVIVNLALLSTFKYAAFLVTNLNVALAAVHAARPRTIREFYLTYIDLGNRRLTITGRTRPLDNLARHRPWPGLDHRTGRWPGTANPHLIINQQTAMTTRPVSENWPTGNCRGLTAIRYATMARQLLQTPAEQHHPADSPEPRTCSPHRP